MNHSVTIHEFSTGIQPEILADGSWVSRGFTSQYINATLSPVPYGVKRAIANKLFAVVEGTEKEEPAIIGREVYDQASDKWWSVVALVSRGKDEKGRPISVSRYFLSEDKGNLGHILAWMELSKNRQDHWPVFNPNEQRTIGYPTQAELESIEVQSMSKSTLNLNQKFSDVLPPSNLYSPIDIHQIATQKVQFSASFSQQLEGVSWAINVEAVETPGNFTIIQVASNEATRRIKESAKVQPALMPSTFDEAKVRTAIKRLMNNTTVDKEVVELIAKEIKNTEVTPEMWEKIFKGEGAKTALSKYNPIYSKQLAKLLTLRALVLPDTQVELSNWLEPKPKLIDVAQEFAQGFHEQFSSVDSELYSSKLKHFSSLFDHLNSDQGLPKHFIGRVTQGLKWLSKTFLEVDLNKALQQQEEKRRIEQTLTTLLT